MKKSLSALVIIISVLAVFASAMGIFSEGGPGRIEHISVHGERVILHGEGIYKNMSAEVAPQGIAQDYVTLFAAVPLLIIALYLSRSGAVRWRFLLTGVLGYFLVTYLFYLMMGMYNELYLVYVVLLGCSFFAFSFLMLSFDRTNIRSFFSNNTPVKGAGAFLIFNAAAIGFLWLSVVVPPLLISSVPEGLQHYTTLVVQGLDLALLLPIAFVSGIFFIRRKGAGYIIVPVYYIFLSLLMTALTAKIIAMWMLGSNVIPVIFIIPVFNIAAIVFAVLLLKNIRN
jgi:hypothetical protein